MQAKQTYELCSDTKMFVGDTQQQYNDIHT